MEAMTILPSMKTIIVLFFFPFGLFGVSDNSGTEDIAPDENPGNGDVGVNEHNTYSLVGVAANAANDVMSGRGNYRFPGNRFLSELVQHYYDQHQRLSGDPNGRLAIYRQIVEEIRQRGGNFRTPDGEIMPHHETMERVQQCFYNLTRKKKIKKRRTAVAINDDHYDSGNNDNNDDNDPDSENGLVNGAPNREQLAK